MVTRVGRELGERQCLLAPPVGRLELQVYPQRLWLHRVACSLLLPGSKEIGRMGRQIGRLGRQQLVGRTRRQIGRMRRQILGQMVLH